VEEDTSVSRGYKAWPPPPAEDIPVEDVSDEDALVYDRPPGLDELQDTIVQYELAQKRLGSVATTATLQMYDAVGDFMEVSYLMMEALVEELSTGG